MTILSWYFNKVTLYSNHIQLKSALFRILGPPGPQGPAGKDVVPGAIIYNDMNALLEMSKVHSPGTMGKESLY